LNLDFEAADFLYEEGLLVSMKSDVEFCWCKSTYAFGKQGVGLDVSSTNVDDGAELGLLLDLVLILLLFLLCSAGGGGRGGGGRRGSSYRSSSRAGGTGDCGNGARDRLSGRSDFPGRGGGDGESLEGEEDAVRDLHVGWLLMKLVLGRK